MRRVIFKTIVSHPRELPFVILNLEELGDLCDEFLITEADVSHVGVGREFEFDTVFREVIQPRYPKAKYLKLEIREKATPWNGSADISHDNEQLIRSAWTDFFTEVRPKDIVISTDADEVLYRESVKKLIFLLKKWPFANPLSFTLSLNQFLYFLNLNWTNCGFYGPVIAHAGFYQKQEKPQWRYGGRRVRRPMGCHFSWVMTAPQMMEKLLSYAHRAENEDKADLELLENAIAERKYIFGRETDLKLKEIENARNPIFPISLRLSKILINEQLIINPDKFWKYD